MRLPAPVGQYLADWLAERCSFGFIMLNENGNVISWGGALDRLGIGPLVENRLISEQLVFMEGLLPLAETALQLPLVRPDAIHVWDVHLFKTDRGYGLLILDARQEAQILGVFQQKANELALKRAKQAAASGIGAALLPSGFLEDLLLACNMAALQFGVDGKFSLIGRAPQWLARFCPDAGAQPCHLDPANVFAFLENFLNEAQAFWSGGKIGCIKSGLWIEMDEAGKEHLFEAAAINTGQSKILLLSKEHSALTEKQALIQKGREIALDHYTLERRRNELQAAHHDLEERVRQRTRELERMNIRLAGELQHRERLEVERSEILNQLQQAQKMEAIGTLAGGIAHDFNNILSAVIGFTELSLMDAPSGSQLQTNLQHVFSAGQRAKKLIRQILTFSRQSNPETQPVQLRLIMNEVFELLRASLPATIEIRQDLNSNAFVMADPSQLHQVVMNLCTNASHAMQPDGGVLELALRDYDIGPENSAIYPDLLPGSYMEMKVTDSGTGMSKETLDRIYDPFFTTKGKGEGTGMGLSVVHGIIKNCKGDIAATSRIGLGTTFRVILPTIKQVGAPAIHLKSELPRGSERILFVDDEPLLTDLALRTLQSLGYQVETFNDSTAALQAYLEAPERFDLVVTDMYMPKMTGKVLAREISKIRPKVPIILCSGYGGGLVHPNPLDQHISHYLMKPYGRKELATTVRRILDKKA
jgi:signal transduction histidine kinase/ActR/RegA family two-component response regulator